MPEDPHRRARATHRRHPQLVDNRIVHAAYPVQIARWEPWQCSAIETPLHVRLVRRRDFGVAEVGVAELRVPEDFVATARSAVQAVGGGAEFEELNPEIEPTYEELWATFSKTHKLVGSTYVDLTKEEGRITLMDARHFQGEYRHMVYFELQDIKDGECMVIGRKKVEKPFIEKWMRDKRMDPIYLIDKSQRYYYKYFGMFPKPELCPPECYNNWQGFAVHKMPLVDLAAHVHGAALRHLRRRWPQRVGCAPADKASTRDHGRAYRDAGSQLARAAARAVGLDGAARIGVGGHKDDAKVDVPPALDVHAHVHARLCLHSHLHLLHPALRCVRRTGRMQVGHAR